LKLSFQISFRKINAIINVREICVIFLNSVPFQCKTAKMISTLVKINANNCFVCSHVIWVVPEGHFAIYGDDFAGAVVWTFVFCRFFAFWTAKSYFGFVLYNPDKNYLRLNVIKICSNNENNKKSSF